MMAVFSFFGIIFIAVLALAIMLFGVTSFGTLIVVGLQLILNFWYILVPLFICTLLMIYLDGIFLPLLAIVLLFGIILFFVPLNDEQKAQIAEAKAKAGLAAKR